MRSWLKRLIGRTPAAAPAAAAAKPSVPSASTTATPREMPAEAMAGQPGFGARRPLVAVGGEVAGFEFELALASHDRWRSTADPVAQAAHAIALLSSMRSTVEAGRIALAALPAAVLARPAVAAHAARGTMLVITNSAESAGASTAGVPAAQHAQGVRIDELRAQGVQVGMPLADAGRHQGFDFILLPATSVNPEALLATVRQCQASHPGVMLVATGFDSIDDLELALQTGVALVSGRVDAMRATGEKRPLQTAMQRICQLLNRVVTDQDAALIAQGISADVPLSYRMLRYVNSPAVGLGRKVESIEQAVMVLGRNELYRWLSVLLLSSADGRKASRALQEISLARARLLETLARERGAAQPDALFTVGLLSLLDVMLQMPLAEALAPLNLGDAARQALLEQRGEWCDYLALAIDLERHDLDAAALRAGPFGGLDHVLGCSEQAWRWAAAIQGEMRA